ncbi:MAG TPA: hypothetical protein VM936_02235 [Pyrinomonadaceae bacterium]|jgi:predicted metallopeptidase|nr:hypothetical protein [Pyrinomonadaceae bacterium]
MRSEKYQGVGRRRARLSIATPAAARLFAAACALLSCVVAGAQSGARRAAAAEEIPAERAAAAVCAERELDPRGSAPIDVMQDRASLSAAHPDVLAGAARAARLLPVAKELAAESLSALMSEGGVAAAARRAALARVAAVRRIRLDVSLRDNASIVYDDPRAIRFGTIFVASLRSDEAMLSVMAHELTHAADGASGGLRQLFRRVARRAEAGAGLRQISSRRGEELTCDLVGVLAARLFIARHASDEPGARRAARAVEHNCVERDETDAAHLSPRETLRALLAMEPVYAAEVTGESEGDAPAAQLNHPASRTELPASPAWRVAPPRARRGAARAPSNVGAVRRPTR